MNCFIGIDSGGTKTEAVLADEKGHILRRETDSGCNPMDVGTAAASDIIERIVARLMSSAADAGISLYAGIAGVNRIPVPLDETLKREYGFTHVCIEDDRRIVLSGSVGHINGCGLICGTGSSLSVIKESEPIRQIGGLGYLIDTGGSGFELGQAALKYAFRYLDGRGEKTVLPDLIEKELGCGLFEGLEAVYQGGRPFIASLAHVVFDGIRKGDKVCSIIAETGADALAELINVAGAYFPGEYPVIMSGGILRTYPEYVDMIHAKVCSPARLIMASAPPVYGALVEAMWKSGESVNDEVKSTFLKDYSAYCNKYSA